VVSSRRQSDGSGGFDTARRRVLLFRKASRSDYPGPGIGSNCSVARTVKGWSDDAGPVLPCAVVSPNSDGSRSDTDPVPQSCAGRETDASGGAFTLEAGFPPACWHFEDSVGGRQARADKSHSAIRNPGTVEAQILRLDSYKPPE